MSQSREFIGDVLAYVPPPPGGKARYIKLGAAFRDDRGRISFKLDAIPLPQSGWQGWVNILPSKFKPEKEIQGSEDDNPVEAAPGNIQDSDIPF